LTGRLASRKYSHRDLRWVSTPWGYSRRPKSPGFRINTHPTSQPYGRALRDSLLGNSGGTAPDSHRTSFTAVVNGTQSHRRKSGQSGGQSPLPGLIRVRKRPSGGPGEHQATFAASSRRNRNRAQKLKPPTGTRWSSMNQRRTTGLCGSCGRLVRTRCGLQKFYGLLRVLRRRVRRLLTCTHLRWARLGSIQRPADSIYLIHDPHGTRPGAVPEDTTRTATL